MMGAVVAISDLHLGEESSSLNPVLAKTVPPFLADRPEFSNPPINTTPLKLNNLLHQIARQAGGISELVLVGDIIDLSLATYGDCVLQAREFFRVALTGLTPDAVVWVPGNHDHHLWVQICEEEFIEHPLRNGQLPGEYPRISGPGQRSGAMCWRNQGVRFLLALLPPGLRSRFWVAYPNYITTCGGRNLLFHHGHFFDVYQSWIGSSLVEAKSLGELETFNTPYIEFVWYGSGQSGRLSEQIENIYEEIRWASERLGIILDIITLRKYVKWLLGGLKKGGDRGAVLEPKLAGRIARYLRYISLEHKAAPNVYPADFDLVFGHTHRPIAGKKIGRHLIYNAGGWTVDELWPGGENLRSCVFVAVPGEGCQVKRVEIDRAVYDFCHNLNHALREAVHLDLGAPG